MTNLTEIATWDAAVFRLEISTPALGGPGGVMNSQAQSLANRTAYLKQQVELRAPLDSPALTGNPTAPTQAVGNNTTRLATTAFVLGQAADSPPLSDATNAAIGESSRYARQDHVHPAVEQWAPGDFKASAASTPPSGWLICDGSAVSRATYSRLFAAIGTAWGAGNGTTTFNLPDLRGRAIFGRDNMGGVAANRLTFGASGVDGATVGAVGGSQAPQGHSHPVNDPGHGHGVSDPGHGHGVNDPGHGHGVSDPGHTHTYLNRSALVGSPPGGEPRWEGGYSENTGSSGTGISIQGAGTGVSIQGAGTGISINGATTGISTSSVFSGNSGNIPPAAVANVLIYAGIPA